MLSEASTVPYPGLGAMLLGIFIRPRRALQAVAEHGGRRWWLPALILALLIIIAAAVSGPIRNEN